MNDKDDEIKIKLHTFDHRHDFVYPLLLTIRYAHKIVQLRLAMHIRSMKIMVDSVVVPSVIRVYKLTQVKYASQVR